MTRVDSERLQPRRLWQSFDQLLGAVRLRLPLISTRLHSIVFSTTKLLAFVTLPLVHLPHSSQLRLSVASFDFSGQSRRLTSLNWFSRWCTDHRLLRMVVV